ncbi:MAG: ASCH domain-containing protein [Sciscionella sp.]
MTLENDPEDIATLPHAEFAFAGPLRDRLVSAVLSGAKTTTTGLLADYEHGGDPLPQLGQRSLVLDSSGRGVAVIEVTQVRILPLGEVELDHALAEGEGHRTLADWRSDHELFWHSEEVRDELGDPAFTVSDETPVVLERFRLLRRLAGEDADGARSG